MVRAPTAAKRVNTSASPSSASGTVTVNGPAGSAICSESNGSVARVSAAAAVTAAANRPEGRLEEGEDLIAIEGTPSLSTRRRRTASTAAAQGLGERRLV